VDACLTFNTKIVSTTEEDPVVINLLVLCCAYSSPKAKTDLPFITSLEGSNNYFVYTGTNANIPFTISLLCLAQMDLSSAFRKYTQAFSDHSVLNVDCLTLAMQQFTVAFLCAVKASATFTKMKQEDRTIVSNIVGEYTLEALINITVLFNFVCKKCTDKTPSTSLLELCSLLRLAQSFCYSRVGCCDVDGMRDDVLCFVLQWIVADHTMRATVAADLKVDETAVRHLLHVLVRERETGAHCASSRLTLKQQMIDYLATQASDETVRQLYPVAGECSIASRVVFNFTR
jgi:hypothetical protein